MSWEHIKILTALISVLLTGCKEIKGYLETQKPESTTPPEVIQLPPMGNLVPATIYWTESNTYEDGTLIEDVYYHLFVNNESYLVTKDLQFYTEWKKGDCFYVRVGDDAGSLSDKSNEICI